MPYTIRSPPLLANHLLFDKGFGFISMLDRAPGEPACHLAPVAGQGVARRLTVHS